MRSRNPWVLARRRLLGWNVRFDTKVSVANGSGAPNAVLVVLWSFFVALSPIPGSPVAIGRHRTPAPCGVGMRRRPKFDHQSDRSNQLTAWRRREDLPITGAALHGTTLARVDTKQLGPWTSSLPNPRANRPSLAWATPGVGQTRRGLMSTVSLRLWTTARRPVGWLGNVRLVPPRTASVVPASPAASVAAPDGLDDRSTACGRVCGSLA